MLRRIADILTWSKRQPSVSFAYVPVVVVTRRSSDSLR